MKTEAFRRFLKKALSSPHSLKRVDLVLVGARGSASTVETVDVKDPRDFGSEERLEELIASLAETAQSDANGWGTPSKYCLRARFHDDEAQPRSTVVNVHPDGDDDEQGYEAGEPANATGLVAQAHRHTEAFARQLVAQTNAFTQFATESMARMAETISRAEREKLHTFEMIEELHTRKHERELEIHREERKDKALERVVNSVVPLLPIAGGKMLLGPKAPTQVKNSPQMAALREFGKSLSVDELAKAQEVFGPEKVAALLEILTSVSDDEEKDDPNAKRETTSEPSGRNGHSHATETSGFF